jgi:hypothetical protein
MTTKLKKTPSEALDAAVEALVIAADAFAAADEGETTHETTVGDYRVRFQGEKFLSLTLR